ncbi:coproporphyrinogen-III oxidase family protein [Streptomyces sp. NPDC059037]|uniref:coproporphyrinogen-III oxidase family protein n=1 Tax=Streptomyces sp. NPDC059037 TaxID=3346710 RepID=UPI00367B16A2
MHENIPFPEFQEVAAEAEAALRELDLADLATAGILQPVENYYLIGTYPPLKAMEEMRGEDFLSGVGRNCSVYLHIPFCEQRCTFCHFAKEILPQQTRVERYLQALVKEMEIARGHIGRPTARTVYFGGGTPSYLSADQIRRVFGSLRETIDIAPDAEITYELHPSVIDAPDYEERLDALAAAGVNRWVFGVQSMDDRILAKLNRGHTAADVQRLLKMLDDRDATNVSVDLIFGLPYQTMENWYSSIRSLVECGVEKFNIFPLMFKQADPISAHYRKNPEIFPDARGRLLMHFATEAIMKRLGFRRGPLFYYARADTHSQQQEDKYDSIEDINLLPFGVSGFGYVDQVQYYNDCSLDGYMASVESGKLPVWRGSRLPEEERMRRTLMFSLRSGGVDRDAYAARFGADPLERFRADLAPFLDRGLLELDGRVIRATDRGAPFVDSIALHLVSDDVRGRIRESNSRIVDVKRDPLDRYDYSPIERDPVAATVPARRAGRTALPVVL